MTRRLAILLAATLAGILIGACSSLGGDGGGAANLPNRGIAPWETVTHEVDGEEVPLTLIEVAEETLHEPALLDQGGTLILYLEARRTDEDGRLRARIVRSLSEDGGLSWSTPEQVLGPEDVPFAALGVGAPSVVREAAGWRMAFEVDGGASIAVASSNDGVAFSSPVMAVEPGDEGGRVLSPSLADGGVQTLLYHAAVADPEAESVGDAIVVSELAPDGTLTPLAEALSPGVGCTNYNEVEVPCWDAEGVGTPEVRVATSATGRRIFRLFYTGQRGSSVSIGFAASEDGLTFSRYPFNPVIERATGPTNVLSMERFLMLYLTSRGELTLALNDGGQPSVRF